MSIGDGNGVEIIIARYIDRRYQQLKVFQKCPAGSELALNERQVSIQILRSCRNAKTSENPQAKAEIEHCCRSHCRETLPLQEHFPDAALRNIRVENDDRRKRNRVFLTHQAQQERR